jgi:hypothetical protein
MFVYTQFHSAEKESIDDDDYDSDDETRRDWLHSDGGKEMMKRVSFPCVGMPCVCTL